MSHVDILLVEDSPSDVFMAREAFEQAGFPVELHVVCDGAEAMDFLRRRNAYVDAPRPGMVLLDLNLPRKDGREVLAEVKTDPELKLIPVVVLTTSRAEEDIHKAYGLHANCYISKPVDFDSFVDAVKSLQRFWFSVATLPSP
jgi:chemotaxis family two-component system response regulator Rcp1